MRTSEQIHDEYLATSAATGDRPAVESLVARWQSRLLGHAWRVLGDADRARDVVQEAWMEILRGLHRLHDVAAFPAWACRIVSRRCYRGFGHRARDAFEVEEAGLRTSPKHPSTIRRNSPATSKPWCALWLASQLRNELR